LYVGKVVWNRSRKVLDPETGKRVIRVRPQSEWVWRDVPELRIIPDDLWQAVQARLDGQRHAAKGNKHGAKAEVSVFWLP